MDAAKHHEKICHDLISFSRGPGLGPCLRVGLETARELASDYNKP